MNAAVPGTGQGCSVTVLGSSCSIPRPGRACSAYLIAGAGTRAVVDFGSGALANLRLYCEPDQLDAVVISHMHADHFFDLIPLRYALKYGARSNGRKIAVHLPPGGEAILRRVGEAFARESPGDFFDEVFRIHTYDPFAPLALSDATFRFAATTHYIPTFAVRYDLDDISVTYSADTAFDPAVATLASQTSLFLCEATVLPNGDAEALAGHLRPRDAGRLAHLADVRHLCVTHYPSEIGESELRAEASREFGGEISLADDHYRWNCAPASAGAR